MHQVKIPKRSGGHRLIYVPSHKEKAALRRLIPTIEAAIAQAGGAPQAHGFRPMRSIVTNGIQHRGKAWTRTFDLKDFFDTATRDHLAGKLPEPVLSAIMVEGAARQGLPTSPAAATLAALELDNHLRTLCTGNSIVYTRYADDLAFSFNDLALDALLRERVPQIVAECGFMVHPDKTHLLCARNGRRIICGVAVDDAIHPTRAIKRRLRAARHQNNRAQAAGLAEACKLKPPSRGRKRRQWERAVRLIEQMQHVARRLPHDATKVEARRVHKLLRSQPQNITYQMPCNGRRVVYQGPVDDETTHPTDQ